MFALALAIQVLVWGTVPPFAGAVADRFGSLAVLATGALLYCTGLHLDGLFDDAGEFRLSAGLLTGVGLAGCSFTIYRGAFGKL